MAPMDGAGQGEGGQFHFHPDTYLAMVEAEVPLYHDLQRRVADATRGVAVTAVLDLGTGTGETAARVLDAHPDAALVGIDESAPMLAYARRRLPGADLRVQRLEDPLPEGEYDLVISGLAVHHLDATGKADLFRRIAERLKPGGRFVLADVVVPDDPADAVTPVDGVYDRPSRVDEQLEWLRAAGFTATVLWHVRDLAVIAADRAAAT
jgi:tRNA (cmo5U34)-methyltransferase